MCPRGCNNSYADKSESRDINQKCPTHDDDFIRRAIGRKTKKTTKNFARFHFKKEDTRGLHTDLDHAYKRGSSFSFSRPSILLLYIGSALSLLHIRARGFFIHYI